MSRRFPAAVLAVTLLAGLVACGGSGGTQTAGPDTAPAPVKPPTRTVAGLTPVVYPDAFAGVRDAAAHMPSTAKTLAAAFAAADGGDAETGSPAATLRADLTYLLGGHVYLTGLVAATAYATEEPDGPQTEAALAALDANAKDLAKRVGKLIVAESGAGATSGPAPARTPSRGDDEDATLAEVAPTTKGLLGAWRDQTEALSTFAGAALEKNAADKADARTRLTDSAEQLGRYFVTITDGSVRRSEVRDAFEAEFLALTDAVEALADGGRKAYQKFTDAADRSADLAELLADGLASANDLDGETGDKGADLRAGLTGTLTEHVYLVTMTVLATLTADTGSGGASLAVTAAKASLDDNSKELGAAVGKIAGPQREFAFLTSWRTHINNVVDYASYRAGDEETRADQALTSLSAYRRTAGEQLSQAAGKKVSAAAVQKAFTGHIESLIGAIDGVTTALAPPVP